MLKINFALVDVTGPKRERERLRRQLEAGKGFRVSLHGELDQKWRGNDDGASLETGMYVSSFTLEPLD